jgi:hypothetical protein
VDGSGRRSEDRRPAPSLSSGATPEYDHSRQSTDPLVRVRAGQPFRDWTGHARGPLPASRCVYRRRAAGSRPRSRGPGQSKQHPTSAGATSEEAAPSAAAGRGHDADPKVSAGPPRATLSAEAGSHRLRAPLSRGGKPPPTVERARGVELVTDDTLAHDTVPFHLRRASDPALRRKPVVASRLPLRM